MMMLRHCSCNHRNTSDQPQWIQEKWDLTLQMIRCIRMPNHPVWLIEVEEDLFITPFIQLYQSTRMMLPYRNNNHRTRWIQEKWDLTLQMIWYYRMHYHPVWLIVVEEDLWLQTNPSIKPVNEKDGAQKKQHSPITMDWREGRLFSSNDSVFWNA